MSLTLKQTRRQNFTRKQKGGGLFDFFKIGDPDQENVKSWFKKFNPFTKKRTFTEKVEQNFASSVKTVAVAPKQHVTDASAGVKKMAATPIKNVSKIHRVAPKPKIVSGGTRKRKQRKN